MKYEMTYILKPELTKDEQSEQNSLVINLVKELKGTIETPELTFSHKRGGSDENNLRKFAFPIDHHRQGFYYTVIIDLDPTHINTLSKNVSLEKKILRHLIVKDFAPLSPIKEADDMFVPSTPKTVEHIIEEVKKEEVKKVIKPVTKLKKEVKELKEEDKPVAVKNKKVSTKKMKKDIEDLDKELSKIVS